MDKQSTLYQLMGMRMNGVMNGITQRDEDYQFKKFPAYRQDAFQALPFSVKSRLLRPPFSRQRCSFVTSPARTRSSMALSTVLRESCSSLAMVPMAG